LIKHIDPLIVCVTSKKVIRDSIAKALSREGWPIVFQETPADALGTYQEQLTTIIIDPLFNTACPKCGRLDDWANKESRCECGFLPKKGKNAYNEWDKAQHLVVVILPYHAPKYTIAKLREKGYWAVRLKKENTILDLPKVIKHSLKTMSKYYRMT
jgi:CheY-like chemotaxis protein